MFYLLGIFPYEGLSNAVKTVARNFKNISIDCYVGDLDKGAAILQENLYKKYDAVISRGGTSRLLKNYTDIPVIDIGVSKYDILHAIKITENFNKVAIVGFDFLVEKAKKVISDFQKNIFTYTIDSEKNAIKIISNIKNEQFDAVIGDMVTNRVASKLDFNSLLISSDEESIENALDKAIDIININNRLCLTKKLLQKTLERNDEALLLIDKNNKIKMQYNLLNQEKLLPHIKKRLVLDIDNSNVFRSQNNYYSLDVDQENKRLIFLSKLAYQKSKSLNHFPMNTLFFNAFNTFFNCLYSDNEEKVIKSIKQRSYPTTILGTDGTGKRFLLNKLLEGRNNVIKINKGEGNLDKLLNSTIYSQNLSSITDSFIVFEKFEKFTNNERSEIINFLNQTLLFKRNKIFFTCENFEDVCLNSLEKLNCLNQYIKLRDFNQLSTHRIRHFIPLILNVFNEELGRNIIGLTDVAYDFFSKTYWNNNIEQIINTLLIAYNTTENSYISAKELQAAYRQDNSVRAIKKTSVSTTDNSSYNLKILKNSTLDDISYQAIKYNLVQNNYNKTITAKQLGIARTTLWKILKENNDK